MKNKKLFVLTPIGEEGSQIRKKANNVIDFIDDCIGNLDYSLILPHDDVPGSIYHHIVENIIKDDIIIANLTGLNPNVMYEVGLCHALKKRIIYIKKAGEIFPFDIKDERIIEYKRFNKKLKLKLIEMIKSAEELNSPTNLFSIIYDSVIHKNNNIGNIQSIKSVELKQNNKKSLILEVDYESRQRINGRELIYEISKVYQSGGYKVGSIMWNRITGRIEIVSGMQKEILAQLIKTIIFKFKIKTLNIIEDKGNLIE